MTFDLVLEKIKGWLNSLLGFLKYFVGWYDEVKEVVAGIDPEELKKWLVILQDIGDSVKMVIKPREQIGVRSLDSVDFGVIDSKRMLHHGDELLVCFYDGFCDELAEVCEEIQLFANSLFLVPTTESKFADIVIKCCSDNKFAYEQHDGFVQVKIPCPSSAKQYQSYIRHGLMLALGFESNGSDSVMADSSTLTQYDKIALAMYYGKVDDDV